MSQCVRLNMISLTLLSFIVSFKSSSSKSKSSSSFSSPSHSTTSSRDSSVSSSSSSSETNKADKPWPRRIRKKVKKLFVINKSAKKDKNETRTECSSSPPTTATRSSVRFSPVCVVVDENACLCGHKTLKLETDDVSSPPCETGRVNLEFRRHYMTTQREFFRYLNESEDREEIIEEEEEKEDYLDGLFEFDLQELTAYESTL